MKIFRGFRVFEYAQWQKRKPGNAGTPQKVSQIKKTLITNGCHH